MWLNSWTGPPEEAAVLRDLRCGRPLDEILSTSGMTVEQLTDLYVRYLEHRLEQRAIRENRLLVQEARLDLLDLLIETYTHAAAQGDMRAAQLVLAVAGRREELERRQRKENDELAGRLKNAGTPSAEDADLGSRLAHYKSSGQGLLYDAERALELMASGEDE